MTKSWMERYQAGIREKLDWVRFHRIEDTCRAESYCEELIHFGKSNNDPAIIGASLYYLGELEYLKLNFSHAISQCELALIYLANSDAPRLHATCCNLLGVLHMQNYSFVAAMDYYIRGIRICQENNYGFTTGLLYSNISDIYIALNDYREALISLENAWNGYSSEQEEPVFHRHCLISNRINMAYVFIQLRNLPCAKECIQSAEDIMKQQPDNSMDLCSYYQVLSLYAERLNLDEEVKKNIDLFQQAYLASPARSEMVSSAFELVEDFYKYKRYDLVHQLDLVISDILNSDAPPAIRFFFLKIQWELLEDKHSDAAIALTMELLKSYDQEKSYTRRVNHSNIQNLLHRNEEYREAEKWMLMANKDNLTGLWNRRHFEEIFHEKKDEFIECSKPVAMGIMDIDHFKEYNDHYGHLAGDEVLKKVSRLLLDISDVNIECARYGGDEFLFLAFDLTDDEVREKLDMLYLSLLTMDIPHEYSSVSDHITMSMGIIYYPSGITSNTDLHGMIYQADQLLYEVKQHGKNHYIIENTKQA